jgi:hypothetical protein
MTHRLVVRPLLTSLAVALLLAACGDDRVAELVPRLTPSASSVADPSGAADLVVDFGEVAVGATGSQSFGLRNDGRATLTLSTLAVEPPFALDASASGVLAAGEEGLVVATFSPTAVGPSEVVVDVSSDGGSLKVRLTGVGRPPGATECVYGLSAKVLDFGGVAPGGQRELSVRFVNKGAAPCLVRDLGIAASSDPAFQLVGGPVRLLSVPGFSDTSWTLRFAPVSGGDRFSGTMVGTVDAAVAIDVTLVGSAIAAATEKVYLNGPTGLWSWNPSNSTLAKIGDFKSASGVAAPDRMTDTAIDTNGVLYGCSVNATTSRLYRIDPTNAVVLSSLKLDRDVANPQGLTVLPTGELVVSGDGVWIVEPSTGHTLRTLVPKGRYQTSGDIIALPDGSLAWAVSNSGSSGDDVLVRIESPLTAQPVINRVGTLTTRSRVYALGFADDVLYGFTSTGTAFDIDPSRAGGGTGRSAPGTWWGATTNPTRWTQ